MEEERLKVQDELRLSRIENERYRSELAKSEENMRKALMRGVCALNLEAMSIFNENVVHPVPPQQPIVPSPTPTPSSTLTHNSTTRVNSAQLTQSLPRKLIVQNGHITTSRERERDLLARKVKQFCEVNFENEQNTTATSTSNRKSSLEPHICADAVVAAASAEAANKFKLKLLNDNSVNNGVPKNTIAGRLSDSSLKSLNESSSGVKIYSNNKTFDELVEHSISIPTVIFNII